MGPFGTILFQAAQAVGPDMAKFGWQKAKESMHQPREIPVPRMPVMPSPPSLDTLSIPSIPSLASLQPPSLPKLEVPGPIIPSSVRQDGPSPPATVTDSYSAEMEEDTSVACIPCTRRHVYTMATAGTEAAAAGGDYARRKEAATVAAEALVWLQYDVTPEKLARAQAKDRAVIASIMPDVQQMLGWIPMAPQHLVLAWAAVDEARRFGRSRKATERDRQEIATRVADMEGWVGYVESNASGAGDELTLIREARHELVNKGTGLAALDYAEDKLGQAVVMLTPAIDQETAHRLASQTRALKSKFFNQVFSASREKQAKKTLPARPPFLAAMSPWNDGAKWHLDRDTRLPAELKRFLEHRSEDEKESVGDKTGIQPSLPFGGLMGATKQTVRLYENLLLFARTDGIIVRERQLPSDWESLLNGAYSPDLNTIVVSSQANAEDNESLQTLWHEETHGVTDNPRCNPHPTPPEQYETQYEDTPEEITANMSVLLGFTELGLPLEMSDGSTVPGRKWHVSRQRIRQEYPRLADRIFFAVDTLKQAALTGQADSSGCPVWAA